MFPYSFDAPPTRSRYYIYITEEYQVCQTLIKNHGKCLSLCPALSSDDRGGWSCECIVACLEIGWLRPGQVL